MELASASLGRKDNEGSCVFDCESVVIEHFFVPEPESELAATELGFAPGAEPAVSVESELAAVDIAVAVGGVAEVVEAVETVAAVLVVVVEAGVAEFVAAELVVAVVFAAEPVAVAGLEVEVVDIAGTVVGTDPPSVEVAVGTGGTVEDAFGRS